MQISYKTYNIYHWSSKSLSQRNQTEQRNNTYMLQCIREVRKGDSIIIGDIEWDITLQSTGVEDQQFFFEVS